MIAFLSEKLNSLKRSSRQWDSLITDSNLVYRRDIDGLRAVAVLSVILFHVGFNFFSGGFVGVDIFFVISGYLISQRIVSGYEKGDFSFTQFYVRRIRRLFPAMASTVLGSLLAGIVLLYPDSLIRLCWSAVSAIFSVANIHFFLEAGYWDSSSSTKPLLHTWSLGVEEQFYIFWPFIILGLLTIAKRFSLVVLVAITLASLVFTTISTPDNPDAAFYLTPFRMYEFGIGAICVWFDRISWKKSQTGKIGQSVLFLSGLLMILFSITLFDESDVFPGWIAVIPAMGTAFVILAKNPVGLGLLLTNSVSRYIGLISYSLYLVHWPVMAFFRLGQGNLVEDRLILILGCIFILSVLQYHLVETPLRTPPPSREGKNLKTVTTFATAGGVAVLMSVCALFVVVSGGMPSRYNSDIKELASFTKEDVNLERRRNKQKICRADKNDTVCGRIDDGAINVLVVGDSHTPDGLNMLITAFPDVNYLYAGEVGCPLLRGLTSVSEECAAYNKRRFEDIDSLVPSLDFVVFSQRARLEHVEATLNALDWFAERGTAIIVFGAGPQFRQYVVPSIIEHGSVSGLDTALHAKSITNHYEADDILGLYVENLDGVYIRKRDFFCPGGICKVVLNSGSPLMFDRSHLSLDASRAFGIHIATVYKDLFSPG